MKIAYFHNSNELLGEFTSADPERPTFYWFGDRFFDHYGCGGSKYWYLFLKDPAAESISMRARAGEFRGFDDLWQGYLLYREELARGEYTEPPILMSFDRMTPDLSAQYHKDEDVYEVLHPTPGVRFRLYSTPDERRQSVGMPLVEIPELVRLLPELKVSLPFVTPDLVDGKYKYDRWVPMVTERNGTWL